MKTCFCILALLTTTIVIAQQTPQSLQEYKKKVDSLLVFSQRNNLPFTIKVPKTFTDPGKPLNVTGDFENIHPDAVIINKTSRGTIYSLSPDKMAVLVPDLQLLEKMPGSNQYFILPPKYNMPNPLYPQVKPRRKRE